MPFYESVFIARQEISSQQFETLGDQFSEIIGDGGGKVTKRENWGLKGLAYRINKSRKAHYMLFNIDAPAEAISEMERQMRLSDDILRYMTIKISELNNEPSVQAKNKTSKSHDDNSKTRGEVEFTARTPEERASEKPEERTSEKPEERASEGEYNNTGEKTVKPEEVDDRGANNKKTPESEETAEKEG